MRYLLLFLLSISSFLSCKLEYNMRTHEGNDFLVHANKINGKMEAFFQKDVVVKEFLSIKNDTILIIDAHSYFKSPVQLNTKDKNGKRSGIWITGNSKYFEICNYRKGKKHGSSLSFLKDNESIVSHYKKGLLDGLFEKKIGDKVFVRRIYKKDKIISSKIISPSW